ncbi:hydrogenase maturation protease [Dehalococcoidales bacterium]|nr:hydrogenase maturation protease [Dehalococcoidales bacterium]MCL0091561.1 hydrogenase maturation protease [Dehalococcoidales bacterium]
MKTLVLGLGNPILSDDSVGFRVIQELKVRFDKRIRFQEEVESHKPLTLVASSASGLNVLDLIVGYDKVIIIDSIKTEGGEAGKIYRLSTEDLGLTRHSASPHDVNLATALELGKKLGAALPQQIIIFAIEVVDITTFSEGCTPEVEKAIPLAASVVAEELDSS